MVSLKRSIFLVVAAGTLFFNFSLSWLTLAAAHQLGWWAYVAYFGATMLLFNLTHQLLLPIGERRGFGFGFIDRYLRFDLQRLYRWPWPQLRRRGSVVVNVAVMVLLGPVFFAMSVRVLGLTQDRVWRQAFIATAIATVLWVTIYLGLVEVVWETITMMN